MGRFSPYHVDNVVGIHRSEISFLALASQAKMADVRQNGRCFYFRQIKNVVAGKS
jgi:hypothetical protein